MSSAHLPIEVADKIRRRILRDMNPSLVAVNTKLALAVLIGGLVSLSVCGQFGMGMTGWAEVFSHHIHEHMPPLVCASICGTAYAIFPTLLLRLVFCSPMQFQAILRKHFLSVAVWYSGIGYGLATYGEHGQQSAEIVLWTIAAVVTSYVLSYALTKVLPRWNILEALEPRT